MLGLNKAPGMLDSRASGLRIGRTYQGRLVSGPNPLEVLGSGRLTGGVGLEPKVPTKMFHDIDEKSRITF